MDLQALQESRCPEAHTLDSWLGCCLAGSRCSPDLCRLVHEAYGMQEGLDGNLHQRGPRLPIEGGELAYCTYWILRGVFLLLMHVAKVSQLKAGDLLPGRFCHMNPDKSGSLHRVFLAGRGSIGEKYKTIGDLMRAAGRSCRPELLSMDCCFAGDPALDLVDVGDGDVDVSLFRAAKARLIKRYKMTPHIAEVIHEAMRHS